SLHEIFGSFKPLDVRDYLVRLHTEAKVFGRRRDPLLDSGFFQQLAEAEIHFDGVELGRVVRQKLGLRKFLRIELWLPAGIGPARSSCVKLRHNRSDNSEGIIPSASSWFSKRL